MRLFGSDKFRLAVSIDGSSFLDGLIVDTCAPCPRCAVAAIMVAGKPADASQPF
jgi:hypothetical protein